MERTRWQDWTVFFVGLILVLVAFVRPTVAPSGASGWPPALVLTGAFAIAGLIATIVAGYALATDRMWEEWLALVTGGWLIAAPWALRFSADGLLMWLSVGAGVVIAAMAMLSLGEADR